MNLRRVSLIVSLSAAVFLSGCATTGLVDMSGYPPFREARAADMVLHFYQWNHFFITRPDFRENGFLRPLNRESLNTALDTLKVRREMAVIVIGWNYDPQQMVQIARDWRDLLGALGFNRVVCVCGDEDDKKLDGLPVIDDWRQPVEHAKTIEILP